MADPNISLLIGFVTPEDKDTKDGKPSSSKAKTTGDL